MPEPGHFYLELRGSFSTTNQGFDTTGGRHTLAAPLFVDNNALTPTRLYDGNMQLYGEVGVATRLAVLADFQLVRGLRLARGGSDLTSLGIGDLDAGLRVLLFDEEVTCSLQATLGIPTGSSTATLPLGTGDLRGTFVLSVGRVGTHVPLYFAIDLGGTVRGSGNQRVQVISNVAAPYVTSAPVDYASELVFGGELGYLAAVSHGRHRVRLSPRVRLDGRYGTRAPATPASAEWIDAPIAPESVRFVRVTAGFGVEVAVPTRRVDRPIPSLIIDATGGAFVWGEGLPAAGQVSLAFGVKR